jgi:uncharacterized protein DUF3800
VPKTVYCDEAGFTGNNLLDAQQPYYAYAAVTIEPEEAEAIVARVLRDCRIEAGELKGHRLLRSKRGRKAVADVHRACGERTTISIWHKRYTLASKFFEHIFEPVLAAQNSIFYRIGFHKFISNILYFESITDNERAAAALEAFQRFLQFPGGQQPDSIFPVTTLNTDYSGVIRDIETFTICHRKAIAADALSYGAENSLYRWMLEVSFSALWGLLGIISEVAGDEALQVYCDDSRPLFEHRSHFDIMIGRTDRHYSAFDPTVSITFNLAEPLTFVSSIDHAGIQLADVVASTAVHVLKSAIRPDKRGWEWLSLPSIPIRVLPDPRVFDLRNRAVFINTIVLRELVDRTLKGLSLYEGMPEVIARAGTLHIAFLESHPHLPRQK